MNLLTRISARTMRRRPARSAAMLALVVVPVAATTVGLSLIAGGIHGDEIKEDQAYGRTHLILDENIDPRTQRSVAEVASSEGLHDAQAVRIVDGWAVIGNEQVRYTEADLGNPLLENFVDLRSGRLPQEAGEAVVTIGSNDATGHALSRKVRQAGGFTEPRQSLRIVGVVANFYRPNAVIVHPGTTMQAPDTAVVSPGLTRVQTLFALSGGIPEAQRIVEDRFPERSSPPTTVVVSPTAATVVSGPSAEVVAAPKNATGNVSYTSRGTASSIRRGWYLPAVFAAIVLMTWTSMVIASGLSIGAARRRRDLGILGVNGADASALRGAVRADGIVLGVVGSTTGVLLALPILVIIDQLLVKADALTTVRAGASPWLLAGPLIGVVATVRAASNASKGVARQPVADLLAARSSATLGLPAGKLGRFTTASLLILTAVAVGNLARSGWGHPNSGDSGASTFFLFTMLPVAAGLIGVLSSRAILRLPQIVNRAGLTLRLAARDLQRFGSRTAGATSAIAVTLALATATAAATAPPGLGRPELPVSTVGSGSGPKPFVLRIGGLGFQEVEGVTISRPLTRAQIEQARRAVGKRATFSAYTVAQSYGGAGATNESQVFACADNAAELSELTTNLADGCLGVTPVLFTADQIAALPPALANPLRENQPVAWSSIQLTGTPVNPQLRFNGTAVPLATPDSTTLGVLSEPLTNLLWEGPIINIAVPPGVWADLGLATIQRSVVVIRDPAATEEEASALYQAVVDSIAINDQNQSAFSYSFGGRSISRTQVPAPGISGWVALGVTLVILMVLALSLGLVRLETRMEEQTMVSQGATARQRAGVVAWRAALTVAVAAIAAVCVVTPIAAAATIETGLHLPQWYWVLGMIVGLPALAYALFFTAGLRRLSQISAS